MVKPKGSTESPAKAAASKLTMQGISGANCARKSPILTSSPAGTGGNATESPAGKRSELNPDALALSLYVIGGEENGDKPVPPKRLELCSSAKDLVWRSLRFTDNNYRSVFEFKLAPALSIPVAGPSPDRAGESGGGGGNLKLLEWSDSSGKRCVSEGNAKCSRSRMVLVCASSSEPPLKKVKKPSASSESSSKTMSNLIETVSFRPAGAEEDMDLKSALIEFPSKTINGTDEKCLVYRAVSLEPVGTEEIETKSDFLENRKPTEEIKAICWDSSDVLVEKCLRSRKIPFRVLRTECDDKKTSLTGLPDASADKRQSQKVEGSASSKKKVSKQKISCFFIGEPVPEEEAREKWLWRYELKESQKSNCQSWKLNAGEEDEIIMNVKSHYTRANVDGCIFNLGDCAYVKGDGREKHVGRIVEFFETTDDEGYFRVQWFFKAEDTVMKTEAAFHEKKRLFYSTLMNDNLLDCIISKVSVVQMAPTVGLQLNPISSDFYFDMEYCVEYSTFCNMPTDDSVASCDLSNPDDIEAFHAIITATPLKNMPSCDTHKAEVALLDLYSGCGGMSTGLCLGAKLSSVNLVTRWAVDADRSACDSLKLNHPETHVRTESAEDFLELLKGWERLCQWYVFNNLSRTRKSRAGDEGEEVKSRVNSPPGVKNPGKEYEVLRLLDICYGDPCKTGKRGLKFKVRWKGYSSDEDTWEPIEGLSNCQERIQDFIKSALKSKILPLPGDVDVICGGPPCQGISGYNRFRSIGSPLSDERNRQIIVFMDIVKFLRPKYVLMENVVDILRFDNGSLARYALSRLVHMKYQARLGTIASGCYGLPQFRLRVFLWGALPSEKLPQFPLPTHDVVVRYWPPPEFERNTVAYDEGEHRELEEAVILRDAISDLPAVMNNETREQMAYQMPPETEFQKYMRLTKDEMIMSAKKAEVEPMLYDHRPYQLSEDTCLRVCQIPHRKGANFRDLPGVVVGPDNVAYRDPRMEPVMLPSGRPLLKLQF
ncbi:DNA (cytosine-5)-methyltransferase CMT2-like isoform X2 [Diospyros lotus]|uniref:DNA (cytosine-5)-methyltransferase CMT2-like isoform X2 n=1 Tax=Diospyros lotus TaxID=55363 RepID=UPI002256E89E|nr:DNA (cytosine-5)-methyltransferase CMT2-like isoform X2 [Diospyros lotus]